MTHLGGVCTCSLRYRAVVRMNDEDNGKEVRQKVQRKSCYRRRLSPPRLPLSCGAVDWWVAIDLRELQLRHSLVQCIDITALTLIDLFLSATRTIIRINMNTARLLPRMQPLRQAAFKQPVSTTMRQMQQPLFRSARPFGTSRVLRRSKVR